MDQQILERVPVLAGRHDGVHGFLQLHEGGTQRFRYEAAAEIAEISFFFSCDVVRSVRGERFESRQQLLRAFLAGDGFHAGVQVNAVRRALFQRPVQEAEERPPARNQGRGNSEMPGGPVKGKRRGRRPGCRHPAETRRSCPPIVPFPFAGHPRIHTGPATIRGLPFPGRCGARSQRMGAMELGEFQPGRFHDIHDFLRILIHENSPRGGSGRNPEPRRRRNVTRTSGMKDEAAEMGSHPHGG